MSGADLVVIGAGPAGLAAAREARRLGVEVLVIDEYPHAGGQYYRQPWVAGREGSRQAREGARLIAETKRLGVELWTGTQAWGVFPGLRLGLDRAGRGVELTARRLIVATGAHDRTLAFPGWTLPGVMTPGAAQSLLKSQGVAPGDRALVAGSGPFLLLAAAELLAAGVRVAAVVESARWSWRALARFARFPSRWRELLGLTTRLARHGVPIMLGRAVVCAEGGETLEAVRVRALDARGRAIGPARTFEVDVLAIAHGFRVASELTSVAGCAHRFDERRGGRICAVDADSGATSVEHLYVAGEVTGLGGARVALAEGRIAGLSAARSLGAWDAEADRRLGAARRARRREQGFADLVNGAFAPPEGLVEIVTEDTVVCRCEEVSAGDLRRAVAAGATDAGTVKRWTRCGMGHCQGRMCGFTAARWTAALSGRGLAEVGVNAPRIPVKPVPLARILEGAGR